MLRKPALSEANRKLAHLRQKQADELTKSPGWALMMEWQRCAYTSPPATSPDRVLLAQMINEALKEAADARAKPRSAHEI